MRPPAAALHAMDHAIDDLLDHLVSEYADRRARGGEGGYEDLLLRAPEAHRPALARCLRMIDAGTAEAPSASLLPGTQLAGYRIVREIGRGGMSIVHLATQLDLARPVALKVLRPGLALEGRHVDRFRREALAIARLAHAHIVQVHAVGETRGWHWIAMEHVDGKNLAQVYAEIFDATLGASERSGRGRGPTAAALAAAAGNPALAEPGRSFEAALAQLLAPVARAIGVAHELGIVHRDVKPSNVLVGLDGRARIADFGLAKGDLDPALSLSGEPLGTPHYMSPEQASAARAPVDGRTDVYSLGVALYEGLAGRRPFEGASALEVLDRIRDEAPPRIGAVAPWVSRDAAAVVERAMAREPSERYASAFELAADLEALAEGRRTRAVQDEGGFVALIRRETRRVVSGQAYELRSRTTFLGLPLVHWHFGPNPRPGRLRIARGWWAIGDVAFGALAQGTFACGALSMGVFATGGICLGAVGLGVAPAAGIALGWMAQGGIAAGWAAFGGVAVGVYAGGGLAYGLHVVSERMTDPEAVEYFRTYAPWVRRLLRIDD